MQTKVTEESFLNTVKVNIHKLYQKWEYLDKTSGYPINYQGITTKSEPLLLQLNRLTGKRVLDIGCNSGLYSYIAGYYAKSVIGCDLEQILIQRANVSRNFFDSYYNTTQVNFYCGNFLDKLTQGIDAIIATCVLYHIGDTNLQKLMEFMSLHKPLVILQVRPARYAAFKSHPEWGKVSNTTLFDGMFQIKDNLEFLKVCNYENVFITGLNSTLFYSETFPILIAIN